MASFVEHQSSPLAALYRETFPDECFEKSKEMMRNELIEFLKASLKKESKRIHSIIDASPELEPLNKKMEELNDQARFQSLKVDELDNEIGQLGYFYDDKLELLEKEEDYEQLLIVEEEHDEKMGPLLNQVRFHEIKLERLACDRSELSWEISQIQQSIKTKIEGEEKSLKAKIAHVKKLFKQEQDSK